MAPLQVGREAIQIYFCRLPWIALVRTSIHYIRITRFRCNSNFTTPTSLHTVSWFHCAWASAARGALARTGPQEPLGTLQLLLPARVPPSLLLSALGRALGTLSSFLFWMAASCFCCAVGLRGSPPRGRLPFDLGYGSRVSPSGAEAMPKAVTAFSDLPLDMDAVLSQPYEHRYIYHYVCWLHLHS